MPIRPENRERYPADWKAISLRVREEAGWKCEWCGKPDKRISDGSHPPWDEEDTHCVLTVAHLDHTPENCERDNLRALCEKCHNTYDAPTRYANRKQRQRDEAGQMPLGDILKDTE